MKDIKYYLDIADISLNDSQIDALYTYMDMVIEKNKVMNLTAITDPEEFALKHILDSLLILKYVDIFKEKAEGGATLIDVGTGAGFPGIPLKIACPELKVTLLDSLNKRVSFLEEVMTELGLTRIDAIHSRAEDGARKKELRDSFDFAVSRAVANTSTLCEYCMPFVKKDGYFIAYKSGDYKEELANASNAIRLLSGDTPVVVDALLPESDIQRSFVLIKKKGATPKSYPRKAGTAKRTPL